MHNYAVVIQLSSDSTRVAVCRKECKRSFLSCFSHAELIDHAPTRASTYGPCPSLLTDSFLAACSEAFSTRSPEKPFNFGPAVNLDPKVRQREEQAPRGQTIDARF